MALRKSANTVALLASLLTPLGISAFAPAPAAPLAQASSEQPSAPAARSGGISLKLRRQADSIDLVVEGAGTSPQLRQAATADGWIGDLRISASTSLRFGNQRFTAPELGFQSVIFEGSGTSYRLSVMPVRGIPLGRPVVSGDGRDLIISFPASPQLSSSAARFNITQPGRIPGQPVAPPLQPRAVAPPLGQMAVGTMVLRNRSFLNVSGPPVSLTVRNAPARDVLMALAQQGGYGFVLVDDSATQGGTAATASATTSTTGSQSAPTVVKPISISFQREPYDKAINSVLLAAGWQARLEGRLILAGPAVLGKTFGAQVSKIYRLNQSSAGSAADYLASLGASITKVNVITNAVTQGTPQAQQVAGGSVTQQTTSQSITTTETYGAATGPLRGLSGTTDSRLQTITLVGDANLVAVAENYLRQIDLRQRQVALTVRILDIGLSNILDVDNSFAFRFGNNFIVNDQGRLLAAFNSRLPATSSEFDAAPATLTITSSGEATITSQDATLPNTRDTGIGVNGQPIGTAFGFSTARNPGLNYPENQLFNFLRASINSNTTKVLASPTLILSENPEEIRSDGSEAVATLAQSSADSTTSQNASSATVIGRRKANEAFVTVGEQVVVNYTVRSGTGGTVGIVCEPTFGIAGLTFGARVSKIDDNGFVTFTLSPQITGIAGTQDLRGCGQFNILNIRRLDTGSARVRDGQTLVLTGVISDADVQAVTKWPILGDIPLIGQFFRSSAGTRNKRELVVLVTPRILDDNDGGTYGYGYQPSTRDARQLLGS
jgi:type IV pilus assembly protein PilQ